MGKAYQGRLAASASPAAPAPANILRGRLRFAGFGAAIWLAYLGQPMQTAWRNDTLALRALGVAAIGLFAILFVCAFWAMRLLRRRDREISRAVRLGVLALQVALLCAAAPAVGEDVLSMLLFVVVTGFFALPSRAALATAGTAILLVAGLPHLVNGWEPEYNLAFSAFAAALAMWGILQIVERNYQLAAAHSEIARLAVADERNRFARDMHDILGHTLTAITVKAELAGRLVRLAPERAEAEIADLEGLARGALRDVRDTVSGYREVLLAGELASARTVLAAAGIEADLPDTVDEVPADRQELFGWVVREGVTNVVRHSSAKRCWVRITPAQVEITDDGRGPTEGPAGDRAGGDGGWGGSGHGLAGLRERAEAAGGSLGVGRSPQGGFALSLRMP